MRTPSLPANAALQDVAYAQLAAHLAHVHWLALYWNDELRAITNSSENRESSVMMVP